MSSKKWLVMFGAAVLLALGVCAGFNVLVDPFGVFGDPLMNWYSYDETNNPRVAKLAYLEVEHQQYDSYVIGSSSAASYDVEELNAYLDASFYNLFVYGCDTKDYYDFAAYILEHYEARYLVLNLGINEANSYDEGEDSLNDRMHVLTTGGSRIRFYGEYALCNPKYSVEKISSALQDTELPQAFDVFDVATGTYDKRVRDVEKIGDLAVYEAAHGGDFAVEEEKSSLPYIEECVAAVAAIRDLCREKGTELIVIASPVYIGQWEACDEAALRQYKEALAREVDYWDFSCTSISCDSRYFYDATHFRNAVGTMVLAEIFENDAVYRPEDFGTYVTAENCGEYLDRLFAETPTAEPEDYTTDVPILMYHHFDDEVTGDTVVTPETFAAQMEAIAGAGYTAVTTEDLIAYVWRGEELPENPVVITMDDGYLSNYEIAWPILEAYGLKATVFAIGATVGCTEHYKDTEYPITAHFSFKQAREMEASGVIEIQSHTYDMHQWAAFETGDAVRENMLPLDGESEADYAAAVKADLAAWEALSEVELGKAFCALAYPSGRYTELSEVLLHEAGIAVTLSTYDNCRNVLVKGLPQSLYALCRINVTEDMTPEMLLARLSVEE